MTILEISSSEVLWSANRSQKGQGPATVPLRRFHGGFYRSKFRTSGTEADIDDVDRVSMTLGEEAPFGQSILVVEFDTPTNETEEMSYISNWRAQTHNPNLIPN